jgi:hypothetical protein
LEHGCNSQDIPVDVGQAKRIAAWLSTQAPFELAECDGTVYRNGAELAPSEAELVRRPSDIVFHAALAAEPGA